MGFSHLQFYFLELEHLEISLEMEKCNLLFVKCLTADFLFCHRKRNCLVATPVKPFSVIGSNKRNQKIMEKISLAEKCKVNKIDSIAIVREICPRSFQTYR